MDQRMTKNQQLVTKVDKVVTKIGKVVTKTEQLVTKFDQVVTKTDQHPMGIYMLKGQNWFESDKNGSAYDKKSTVSDKSW